jgi:hypothetical protein
MMAAAATDTVKMLQESTRLISSEFAKLCQWVTVEILHNIFIMNQDLDSMQSINIILIYSTLLDLLANKQDGTLPLFSTVWCKVQASLLHVRSIQSIPGLHYFVLLPFEWINEPWWIPDCMHLTYSSTSIYFNDR